MTEKIQYLEKLLEGYRARVLRGETQLDLQVRQVTAQLQKLKLEAEIELRQKDKRPSGLGQFLRSIPSRCCGR